MKSIFIFLACPAGFQNIVKKHTPQVSKLIVKGLENKDVKTCSDKCKQSEFCTSLLVKKAGNKYDCVAFYKNVKGIETEVPKCAKGMTENSKSKRLSVLYI